MLARTEEKFQAGLIESLTGVAPIQSLLAGLFDYAGLYPPAGLRLQCAADNYLDYASGKHAMALGRFIINEDRLKELHLVVGSALDQFKLSVIVPDGNGLDAITNAISCGMPIESLEIKSAQRESTEAIARKLPQPLDTYFEIPFDSHGSKMLHEISEMGVRAKIRMGGIVPDAFPSVSAVVRMLSELARFRVPFKATAGLHHPIRSNRPLTYKAQSEKATMHGFINLCCAAAVLYFGGEESDAERVLQEEDRSAWHIGDDSLQWRHLSWTQDQLSTLRREFFISIGSCSLKEPVEDLQAMGWL